MAAHEKEMHDCIICASALGTNGGTLTLLCGHPFCAECICRWRQRSWRCPVCRVMDNRDLSATAAASAGRSGNIGQVSRRLRPMAEQLLAENGDNVLDVLLQLLKGIQDGTLPADVETAVSDAAGSSAARALSGNTGGTSLDRLVLNQLVTVLQATSALSGASSGQERSQAPGRLSASSRRRRHPSERRRVPAAVQLPVEEPPQALPVAATPTIAEHKPTPAQESEAGPSSQSQAPEALEQRSPLRRLKCNASTQTSDFSDREDRRLRGSRLRRGSRGAALEGALSISPKPRAGPRGYDSAAGSPAPSAADLVDPHGAQPAWHSSRAASASLAEEEPARPAGEASLSSGVNIVSGMEGSGLSTPSAAAKGKERDTGINHMVFRASLELTGPEQRYRRPELPESSTVHRGASAGGSPGQGHPMHNPSPHAAGKQEVERALEEQPTVGCSNAEVAGEAPALDFRQIRRAWEERFGPSRQPGGGPLRKRSLEGPSLSGSTSGCSSASFPASGVSTPLLPTIGQPSGSAAAQAVPISIRRSAFEAPGARVGGSSPDAAPLTAFGAAAPFETSPVSVPGSQVYVSASRPVTSQFITASEQQGISSSGLDVSPDPEPAVAHQPLQPLSVQQTQQQPPPSRAGQHSSDSSEATIPSLLEPPDTATPSASEESLGDLNQADDSTFLASRGTSLARTLSPEELALPEIPHSSSSGSVLPEEVHPLASRDSAPAISMRLPASLLGRRRTRSEAKEARAARQRPQLVPPNTAMQSLANSGSSSPRTMLEPISALPPSFGPGSGQAEQSPAGGSRPVEPSMPRRVGRPQAASLHSLEREQLLLRAVDDVENLVDILLAKWNSLPAAEQPPHLGERLEELFLEASMLEAVRNNQVPKPRAMVEDILARVTLLDAELGTHMGPVPPPSPTSSMGSPHATGARSHGNPSGPSSKPLGSPVRMHLEASETRVGSPGQPNLPSSQQPCQHIIPATAAAPEPSNSGVRSAPQQLTPAPEASAMGQRALQAPQAPVEVAGGQAPMSLQEEPQQPVSPLSVGRMTQGTSMRAGQRLASARAGASERRARRSAAARLAAAPPSGQGAAEAEGALDRFTAFLEHHENELQPRTRQIAELALTLARLSLVTGMSERDARPAMSAPPAPDAQPSPAQQG